MLHKLIFTSIILTGLFLRINGLNWDQGFHLHPDERAIVMVGEKIHWPKTGEWSKILTPASPLNPHFFAYGSLPIYLLKIIANLLAHFDASLNSYEKINLVGRFISALLDSATILIVYLLAKKLSPKKAFAILATFFYAFAVLPIQLSHFYAVDTILNFFIFFGLYCCLRYVEKPSASKLLLLSLSLSLALSTKFTGAFLLLPILTTLFLVSFRQCYHPESEYEYPKIPVYPWRKSPAVAGPRLRGGVIFFLLTILLFTFHFSLLTFLFMPYAFLDFPSFQRDVAEQLQLSSNASAFPYTLQYIGTPAYLYPLQQILIWGLGPIISILSFFGFTSLIPDLSITVYTMILKKRLAFHNVSSGLALGVFAFFYFLIMGHSAVKFMRYFLPLYPFFAILAAKGTIELAAFVRLRTGRLPASLIVGLIVLASLFWPLSFVKIYDQPNTRVSASAWISQNVTPGSTLAVEHWDDRLPLVGSEKYSFVEMPMYEPDRSQLKWKTVDENLQKADYLILASNRLYVPLQKLSDCSKIKYEWRCYPKTAEYYQKLFDGGLGFEKVAEFSNFPSLSLFTYHLSLPDDRADENFTVFDHPKVIIFKKTRS